MPVHTFNCPTCGAPLDYDGGPETTIHCPFCNSSVVVPEELRPEAPTQVVITTPPSNSRFLMTGIVTVVVLAIMTIGVLLVFLPARRGSTDSLSSAAEIVPPTDLPAPTEIPTETALPPYASPGLSFGEKGIGPGQLNDARYLAVDGNGILYAADYQDGRVQAFDPTGKYLRQFSAGDAETIIHGLAADHEGRVYVAAGDTPDILRFEGSTGQSLGKLTNPAGGEFGALAATAANGLDAAWYEGRWGLITSLEGHREDLVQFDNQGQIAATIPSFISSQTGDPALDVYLAVDGLGKVFALSDGLIYIFSPEGKYLNKFGNQGGSDGSFNFASSIAVDGKGRVFIGDFGVIHVYGTDGRFIADSPVEGSVDAMAVDEQGNLWVLGDDKITRYTLPEP